MSVYSIGLTNGNNTVNKESEEDKMKKENACMDYYDVVKNSWTWERLTEEERKNFMLRLSEFDCSGYIKGSYDYRWEQCKMLYSMFLTALGYRADKNIVQTDKCDALADYRFAWREDENAPLF